MAILSITPDIEKNPWTDLIGKSEVVTAERIARLPRGMTSGKSSVAIMGKLPNGNAVIVQMPLDMLATAVDLFKAKDKTDAERLLDN